MARGGEGGVILELLEMRHCIANDTCALFARNRGLICPQACRCLAMLRTRDEGSPVARRTMGGLRVHSSAPAEDPTSSSWPEGGPGGCDSPSSDIMFVAEWYENEIAANSAIMPKQSEEQLSSCGASEWGVCFASAAGQGEAESDGAAATDGLGGFPGNEEGSEMLDDDNNMLVDYNSNFGSECSFA